MFLLIVHCHISSPYFFQHIETLLLALFCANCVTSQYTVVTKLMMVVSVLDLYFNYSYLYWPIHLTGCLLSSLLSPQRICMQWRILDLFMVNPGSFSVYIFFVGLADGCDRLPVLFSVEFVGLVYRTISVITSWLRRFPSIRYDRTYSTRIR